MIPPGSDNRRIGFLQGERDQEGLPPPSPFCRDHRKAPEEPGFEEIGDMVFYRYKHSPPSIF